ncbi:MAG: hypothetical protein J0J00_03655, partial [Microbacterium sp.]|nr:hypothetical protein [Microbacterium sp.]
MNTIARVETFLVPPRWLFVRIETDDGVVGWGEASLEGSAEVVRRAVEQHAELLVGADARRIEDLHAVMTKGTFYRGGPVFASAVAGIDQALWDIAGKSLGAPVHRLLGGHVRDRVSVRRGPLLGIGTPQHRRDEDEPRHHHGHGGAGG